MDNVLEIEMRVIPDIVAPQGFSLSFEEILDAIITAQDNGVEVEAIRIVTPVGALALWGFPLRRKA